MFLPTALLALCVFIVSGCTIRDKGPIRIINGTEAKHGQFPFIVNLGTPSNVHFCAGSIITDRWVLTAAHCVDENNPTRLFAGTHSISSPGSEYEVEERVRHPSYVLNKYIHDIALVKSSKPINFTEVIATAQLPKQAISDGVNVTIAGWGYDGDGCRSDKLLYFTASIVANEECKKIHMPHGLPVGDKDICAFSGVGQGCCYGDSGGPLVDSETKALYGVVSRGKLCALGFPDVYTSVYHYLDWIESVIN